MFFILFIATCC